MKKFFFILFFSAFCNFLYSQHNVSLELLTKHIYTLADDAMRGRYAGSSEGYQAALYIEKQFEEIGLTPFENTDFLQAFYLTNNKKCHNIIGIIEGKDSLLKNEYIIIGAHYDHLGYKFINDKIDVYNGADDNASGVATLIELARTLKKKENELKRSVIFAAFDAEEIGLIGSRYFSKQIPASKVKLMISLDMVGYLKQSKKLYVKGVANIENIKNLIKNIPFPQSSTIVLQNYETSILYATDTESYAKLGVPTLHITTGMKSPYHTTKDDADKIDYEGLMTITNFMIDLIDTLAKQNHLSPSGKKAHRNRGLAPFQAGLILNIGSNAGVLQKTAFHSTKLGFAIAAGPYMQINTKRIAIRTEVLYENKTFSFPQQINYTSKPIKITSQAITVPVSLLLISNLIEDSFYYYAGIGGFYTYNFHGKNAGKRMDFNKDINHHEGGIQSNIGFSAYKVNIGVTFRRSLSPTIINTPSVKNRSVYFSIGYSF